MRQRSCIKQECLAVLCALAAGEPSDHHVRIRARLEVGEQPPPAADSVAIDVSALAESGVLFQDRSRRRPGDGDFFGEAVIGGQPYAIRGYWNTGRNGARFLKLRFFVVRTPPPRDPES